MNENVHTGLNSKAIGNFQAHSKNIHERMPIPKASNLRANVIGRTEGLFLRVFRPRADELRMDSLMFHKKGNEKSIFSGFFHPVSGNV